LGGGQKRAAVALKVAKGGAVGGGATPLPDYDDLDTPTVIRNRRVGQKLDTQAADYLDIPAFLRRQAD
ncbi:MAG: cell division protein FtsZ, partial [Acidiferrobacter sp.]